MNQFRWGTIVPWIAGTGGFCAVYLSQITIPSGWASYISLAALAGLDSICGGVRSGLEGKFHDDIFLTGFLMNTVLSAALAYLGDRIGVDLFLAAVVMLGGRVFLNLSLIRRYWLTNRQMNRRRENPAS
jgi:small basic protein